MAVWFGTSLIRLIYQSMPDGGLVLDGSGSIVVMRKGRLADS